MYKEQDKINTILRSLRAIKKDHALEMIVVDGEKSGSTIARIDDPAVIRLNSEKGRAWQMNKGASTASGDIDSRCARSSIACLTSGLRSKFATDDALVATGLTAGTSTPASRHREITM